jgi:pimeloyl-ACP methyl ester carboxylesterase
MLWILAWLGACRPLSLDPFLYDPEPAPPGGYHFSTAVIPAFETLRVVTPDGETLDGVFIASSGRRPDITLLYFHGQSNHVGSSWERLEFLYPLGYQLALVDPRGYGRSTGTPSERGLQTDERAIQRALVARSDVDASRLVYYGHSLGAALAVDLASVTEPAVLVTESAFTSVAALVRDATYVDFPRSLVAESGWDNLGKVPGIGSPYLLLHGSEDVYVDPRYSKELAAAHTGTTELVEVPGADHTDVPQTMGLERYRAVLGEFVEAAIALP